MNIVNNDEKQQNSRLQQIKDRLTKLLSTEQGKQTWRPERFGSINFIEYGPSNDKRDCYDLCEDPPMEVVEFLAHSKNDIEYLIKELEYMINGGPMG